MTNRDDNRNFSGNERDMTNNRLEGQSSIPGDLPDNEHDRERLQPEETTINLPDVSDIPGQENVSAPPLGELADTTISSDDEEGGRVFGDTGRRRNADYEMGTDADVSQEERDLLADADYLRTGDDQRLKRASMDNEDFQGEALNERSFGEERSGSDLDIPEETDETASTSMGQGDEENKYYSLGSDDNDNVVEGTP